MKKISLLLLIIGVGAIGFSIFMLRLADFGTDPFTTMNLGISSFIGVSFGNLQLAINILLLIIIAIISRKFIGIGTVANMVFVGYISDFFVVLFTTFYGDSLSLSIRIILLIIGVILSSLGVAMYMHSAMGVAPYDAIPSIIKLKTNEHITFRTGRVIIDIIAVWVGFLFGATIGLGTIITASFMGPLIQHFKSLLETRVVVHDDTYVKNQT